MATRGPSQSALWPLLVRIEQPVQMHDEVPHMGVVHGPVRGVFPGVVGLRIIRIDADNIEFLEVGAFGDSSERMLTAATPASDRFGWEFDTAA